MKHEHVLYEESVSSQIDLEAILVKLCHPTRGLNWDLHQAEAAIELYRKWLFLHEVFPEERFSPSQTIDQVWHTHILDNAKYSIDCEQLFGRMLYHNPYAGMLGPDDEVLQQQRFKHTKKRFQELFPELAEALQGDPLCDSNYCDDTTAITAIVRPTREALKSLQIAQ